MQEASARAELLERYKLAQQEYRAEVNLGTERQKLFITLNPAVAAFAANSESMLIAGAALALAAGASFVGAELVVRSHGRYQHTRDVLLRLARELGFESDWETTGGMREARGLPRAEGPRVTTLVRRLLLAYALADILAIGVLAALSLLRF